MIIFQRFAAFLAPLTSGRVTIATSAVYSSKVIDADWGVSSVDKLISNILNFCGDRRNGLFIPRSVCD